MVQIKAMTMYASKPGLIIGFHGCDRIVVNQLINGLDDLFFSRNSYDWLGHGIYFWENDRGHALRFAQELSIRKKKSHDIKEPAVVGAILDLGFCLDLSNIEYLEFLKETYNNLFDLFCASGAPMPENIHPPGSRDLLLRKLDCMVIEAFHHEQMMANKRPFDSVRSAFIEGEPIYPNAGFYSRSHIQLCIRNPNCIKGYFLPRIANDQWLVP